MDTDSKSGIKNTSWLKLRSGCDIRGSEEQLTDCWHDVVLADGDILPGEADMIRRRCPRARLHRLPDNGRVTARWKQLIPVRDELLGVYFAVRDGAASLQAIAERAGVEREKALIALTALRECGLIAFTREPWQTRLTGQKKGNPLDTPVMRLLGRL